MLGAVALIYELRTPTLRGVAGTVILLFAPFLLINIARFPVYLLSVYAMLVPFNDLLNTAAGPTLTRILAMLIAGCLVASMLLRRQIVTPSRALIALLALTSYLALTIFWAIDQHTALNAFFIFVSQAGLFTVIALYPFSKRDLFLLLGATLIGAVAQSGYGDYLFIHGSQIFGSRLYIGDQNAHSIDPNAFATALIAPIMITLSLFLRSRILIAKLVFFAALATMMYGFIVSGSRGAAIGLAIAVLFLVWRPRFRAGMFVTVAAALLAAASSPLGQRFAEPDVANANGRMDIWKVGIASLHQYWLGGAGIGNFTNAFVQYYFATAHMWLPWDRVAHSIFIQSVVEGGIVGFALFLTFWYLQFRTLAGVPPENPLSDICVALRAGLLGVLIAGFGLNLMEYKYTWLLFALIAVMRTVLSAAKPSGKPRDGFE